MRALGETRDRRAASRRLVRRTGGALALAALVAAALVGPAGAQLAEPSSEFTLSARLDLPREANGGGTVALDGRSLYIATERRLFIFDRAGGSMATVGRLSAPRATVPVVKAGGGRVAVGIEAPGPEEVNDEPPRRGRRNRGRVSIVALVNPRSGSLSVVARGRRASRSRCAETVRLRDIDVSGELLVERISGVCPRGRSGGSEFVAYGIRPRRLARLRASNEEIDFRAFQEASDSAYLRSGRLTVLFGERVLRLGNGRPERGPSGAVELTLDGAGRALIVSTIDVNGQRGLRARLVDPGEPLTGGAVVAEGTVVPEGTPGRRSTYRRQTFCEGDLLEESEGALLLRSGPDAATRVLRTLGPGESASALCDAGAAVVFVTDDNTDATSLEILERNGEPAQP